PRAPPRAAAAVRRSRPIFRWPAALWVLFEATTIRPHGLLWRLGHPTESTSKPLGPVHGVPAVLGGIFAIPTLASSVDHGPLSSVHRAENLQKKQQTMCHEGRGPRWRRIAHLLYSARICTLSPAPCDAAQAPSRQRRRFGSA